jgi:hypothetical protein
MPCGQTSPPKCQSTGRRRPKLAKSLHVSAQYSDVGQRWTTKASGSFARRSGLQYVKGGLGCASLIHVANTEGASCVCQSWHDGVREAKEWAHLLADVGPEGDKSSHRTKHGRSGRH